LLPHRDPAIGGPPVVAVEDEGRGIRGLEIVDLIEELEMEMGLEADARVSDLADDVPRVDPSALANAYGPATKMGQEHVVSLALQDHEVAGERTDVSRTHSKRGYGHRSQIPKEVKSLSIRLAIARHGDRPTDGSTDHALPPVRVLGGYARHRVSHERLPERARSCRVHRNEIVGELLVTGAPNEAPGPFDRNLENGYRMRLIDHDMASP
jgi:hypothetical protein